MIDSKEKKTSGHKFVRNYKLSWFRYHSTQFVELMQMSYYCIFKDFSLNAEKMAPIRPRLF